MLWVMRHSGSKLYTTAYEEQNEGTCRGLYMYALAFRGR
jgi:hypothetical protein